MAAIAQPTGMVPSASPQGKGMQAPPSIGIVYGKLVDSSGKSIADASVMLMGMKMDTASKRFKEVMLKAAVTKSNGAFRFEELPIAGPMTLKISVSGYKAIDRKFVIMEMPTGTKTPPTGTPPNSSAPPAMNFSANDFEKDLGKIVLTIEPMELQNITIVATKPGLKMDIDKKVFNVEKNLVTVGGTALDVMRNVPTINVDIDGNVTMRNATPQIFVDGRPTTLSLDQIPADAIENVEVITNPSAKYDASGGNAGILNIVLKKNKKSGYNGNVNAGIDKRGGINAGAGISYRKNKINVSANAFVNQMKNQTEGETHITDLFSNPSLQVDQYSNVKNNGGFMFGKAGLDYFATDRSTFSLSLIKVHGNMQPTDFMRSDSSYTDGTYKSYSERTASTDRQFNATGFQAGYKYLFPRKGEELTADINVFAGKMESEALFNTNVYNEKGGSSLNEISQQILGIGSNKFITMQTDYVRPLKNGAKLEAGLRAQLRNMDNEQGNYYYAPGEKQYVKIPNSSANYKSQDNVYAAYLSYGGTIKNFGYKVGLRAENSTYTGEMTDTKQQFSNSYPISLFPSIFLSQKLKKNQELQLSYTRRVNRPFFLQLIPFVDSSNQLNWTMGNPELRPEFTSSLEASYTKSFKGNNSIMGSVYYKYTTNLITSVLDTVSLSNGSTHPLTTYVNANSSYLTGLEITSQNQITKWWDMNTNFNIYNSKINSENLGISNDAMWSWFAKFNANFKLPQDFNVQFSGTYQSKTNSPVNNSGGGMGGPPMGGGSKTTAQGYIKANYGFDLAVKKSLLKNNAASVTLAVSDIFSTRVNEQHTYSTFYYQVATRWPDSPMFRLTFAYRFGKMDMSMFKRKNMKGESEGMQGAMQMQ